MRFTETALAGAYVVELEPVRDERGFFARSWCREEFRARGLNPELVQCNVSFNQRRGTLRGMHFQAAPAAEAKLVRCARGAIYDVLVDLRPESSTYTRWLAFELTADNYRAVYLPEGFAHGFVTLEDSSEVFYQMSEFYAPDAARGIRWNDPQLGIEWPVRNPILSPRDASYPDFRP